MVRVSKNGEYTKLKLQIIPINVLKQGYTMCSEFAQLIKMSSENGVCSEKINK